MEESTSDVTSLQASAGFLVFRIELRKVVGHALEFGLREGAVMLREVHGDRD